MCWVLFHLITYFYCVFYSSMQMDILAPKVYQVCWSVYLVKFKKTCQSQSSIRTTTATTAIVTSLSIFRDIALMDPDHEDASLRSDLSLTLSSPHSAHRNDNLISIPLLHYGLCHHPRNIKKFLKSDCLFRSSISRSRWARKILLLSSRLGISIPDSAIVCYHVPPKWVPI